MEMETALSLLRENDSFAVVEHLSRGDALQAANLFAELVLRLYWKEKDLWGAVGIGRAGAQFALQAAEEVRTSDAERAGQLRSIAKGICYNLASFTWPGWDEAGIVPTESDRRVGLDAAKANLRLARELNKGELPLARAYWVLGAQQMANGDRTAASEAFTASGHHAVKAEREAERLLAEGFMLLAELSGSPAGHERLEDVKRALAPLEQGADFIGQLETAQRVFSR